MPKFKKNPNAMPSPMYKMKGSPMYRNFGISPMREETPPQVRLLTRQEKMDRKLDDSKVFRMYMSGPSTGKVFLSE